MLHTTRSIRRSLTALTLAACMTPLSAAAADAPAIRVGLVCGGMTPMVAQTAINDGSFDRGGVRVEKVCFPGGAPAVQALVGRSIDVFIGSFEHVLRQRARGLEVKAYAELYDGMSYELVAKSGSPVRGLADLKGQTLAITAPSSLSETALRIGLDDVHLNPDRDVQIVPAGSGATMVAAIDTNRVGAGMLTEPSIAQLTSEGKYRVVWSPETPYAANVVMASEAWVAQNRPGFTKFLAVMRDEHDRIARNPSSAVAAMRKDFPQVSAPIMLRAIEHELPHIPAGLHVSSRGTQSVLAIELKQGNLKAPVAVAASVDDALLSSAR